MTVDEIAAELGVTEQAVYRWEAGEREPRSKSREQYAEILRVLREAS